MSLLSSYDNLVQLLEKHKRRYRNLPNKFKPVSAEELVALTVPLSQSPITWMSPVKGLGYMTAVKLYKHRKLLDVLDKFDFLVKDLNKCTNFKRTDKNSTFVVPSANYSYINNNVDSFLKYSISDWRVRDFYHPNNFGNSYRPHIHNECSHSLTVKANGCNYHTPQGYGFFFSYYFNHHRKTKVRRRHRNSQRNHFSGFMLAPFDFYGDTITANDVVIKDKDISYNDVYSVEIDKETYIISSEKLEFVGYSWYKDRYIEARTDIVQEIVNFGSYNMYRLKTNHPLYIFFKVLIDTNATISIMQRRENE